MTSFASENKNNQREHFMVLFNKLLKWFCTMNYIDAAV
jgi:hypothetical protein